MTHPRIIRSGEAAALLAVPCFLAEWSRLWAQCPWATAYQSPEFAATWYRVYRERSEPVLVLSRDKSGRIEGLLTLAIKIDTTELVVAGHPQAEYQAWISGEANGEEFGRLALRSIREAFPDAMLELRYLPPGTPIDWLDDSELERLCVRRVCPRPLLRFRDQTKWPLAKANNRKRLKNLRKLGQVELVEVNDPAELQSAINELAVFCDLRQLAMYGIMPFTDDPLKREFHIELMRQPGLLHVTLLKVGGAIASAHINMRGRCSEQLNLILYNPMFARFSPGKFHIHLLAERLIAQGLSYIDLTPGGDPYKIRFATEHDNAHSLTMFPDSTARLAAEARGSAEGCARAVLACMKIHPARAKAWAGKLAATLLCWRRPGVDQSTIVEGATDAGMAEVARDRLGDLLLYRARARRPSKREFVAAALHRLEAGWHVYTLVRNGTLVQSGWMNEHPTAPFLKAQFSGYSMPAHHALLIGVETDGSPTTEIDLVSLLKKMLHDAETAGAAGAIVLSVSRGPRSISAIERVGLRRVGSWQGSPLFQTGDWWKPQVETAMPRLASSSP